MVLGLIFLKYISIAFAEQCQQLDLWTAEPQGEYNFKERKDRYQEMDGWGCQ